MIVGAPLVAALARNWPRRSSLLGFVLAFATAHAVGATTADFPVLFTTRVVAALANAGFLAVALTAGSALVPPDKKGRALAVLLSGTTVATVAGVPGGSVLERCSAGGRPSGLSPSSACPPPSASSPGSPRTARGTTRPTGRPCGRSRPAHQAAVASGDAAGALVNAATFAGFTFLAPVVTGTAGLG
ncbi:MFS transporter OS=Streptomyces tendae OX=1932 GN=F3L20_22515 PE=4 SV=1 [Streptomyces tendae]